MPKYLSRGHNVSWRAPTIDSFKWCRSTDWSKSAVRLHFITRGRRIVPSPRVLTRRRCAPQKLQSQQISLHRRACHMGV